MGSKLILIGGGGHCKSVIESLLKSNDFEDIVITDSHISPGTNIRGIMVAGDDNILSELKDSGFDKAFITLGCIKTSQVRRKIGMRITELGFTSLNIIDPSANVSDSCVLGTGIFIGQGSIVNTEVSIGDYSIINTGALIEHECTIGDYVHIAINATISGGCMISNDVFVGANATIIQGVNVGKNSIIGAGSIVLKDVPPNTTVVGVLSELGRGNA